MCIRFGTGDVYNLGCVHCVKRNKTTRRRMDLKVYARRVYSSNHWRVSSEVFGLRARAAQQKRAHSAVATPDLRSRVCPQELSRVRAVRARARVRERDVEE